MQQTIQREGKSENTHGDPYTDVKHVVLTIRDARNGSSIISVLS